MVLKPWREGSYETQTTIEICKFVFLISIYPIIVHLCRAGYICCSPVQVWTINLCLVVMFNFIRFPLSLGWVNKKLNGGKARGQAWQLLWSINMQFDDFVVQRLFPDTLSSRPAIYRFRVHLALTVERTGSMPKCLTMKGPHFPFPGSCLLISSRKILAIQFQCVWVPTTKDSTSLNRSQRLSKVEIQLLI